MELRTLTGQKIRIIDLDTLESLRIRLEHAQTRLAQLESEEAMSKEMLIKKLHEYNEIKDLCQSLLGKLALVKETTIASIYPEFDLDPKD